jgi:cell division protein ZapA
MGTLRIDVLGELFSIDAKADRNYLEMLLDNYKIMVSLVEKNAGDTLSDPLQVAIMSGLMLCDELYKEKKKSERMKKQAPESADLAEVEKLTLRMLDKIEKAIE